VYLAPLFLSGALLFAAVTAFLNWMIIRHAWAMTHFVRYPVPEPASPTWADWLRLLLFGLVLPRPENGATPADHGLAYETHEFSSGTNRLSAWHIPQPWRRGMVLLFHGYHSCKAQLLTEAKAFHEMGYACFLIDFPGSGDSSGDATTIGRREALDVARTVNYVRDHWQNEKLILFGKSMGSAAILRAVEVQRIEPDAVILECPFDRMVHAVAARCRMVGVPAFPTAALLVFWGSLRLGFNGFRHNPADYARSVRCPVLLMHGANDTKAPCEQVEAIYANLAGDKLVHYFEELGHESYVAKRPEEWKQQVRRFLLGQAEVVVLKAS
jgi:uncharacterized protein